MKFIGRKVKGFKFDGDKYKGLTYNKETDKHIGEVGEIVDYYDYNNSYHVEFDNDYWYYPAAEIEAHLVDEWVVGQEYEFSNSFNSEGWCRSRLIAILPDDCSLRYITKRHNETVWHSYEQIRHIEPKVKEVTIQEIAEKFGVSVESIKIVK